MDKDESKYIGYPKGYKLEAAAAIAMRDRKNGIVSSRYYRHPDFYNMESDKTLTILSKFKTYQQSTEYTCGPCAALMVLEHFGNSRWSELEIAKRMHTKPGVGTTTYEMQDFFKAFGWHVRSSLSEGKYENGASFQDYAIFKKWIGKNLKSKTPVMIEWLDWAGHWAVIIGFDAVSRDSCDDVIIMADPYDSTYHFCDGYSIVPAERFFAMWYDAFLFPRAYSAQQWVIARPR